MGQVELHGVLPALVTPLTPGGAVDEHDLAGLVRRATEEGASGVLVAGSTGEGTLLEPDQRTQLTRVARRAIDDDASSTLHRDRQPPSLVAGASGQTVGALEDDVARLADAGADLVLVLAPHTYPLSPEELRDLHLAVAERAEVDTFVYHIPQLTGSALTPAVLAELATHPRISGMKDSSPDAERRADFVAATRGAERFAVFAGHALTLQAALAAGVDGSITAIANLRTREAVALHDAAARGDVDRAARHQDGLARLVGALAQVGASMPAALKAVLQLEGIITERWCRPPLRSIPPSRLDHVRSALLRAR